MWLALARLIPRRRLRGRRSDAESLHRLELCGEDPNEPEEARCDLFGEQRPGLCSKLDPGGEETIGCIPSSMRAALSVRGSLLEANPHGALVQVDRLEEARGHDVSGETRPGHGSKFALDLLDRRTLHQQALPTGLVGIVRRPGGPDANHEACYQRWQSVSALSRCPSREVGIVKIALGKKGNYAVRAVLDLSLHHRSGLRKAHQIASSMRIPENYLARILADLVRSGLISATAGPGGGYELRRPPSQLCLLDVVDAAEGAIELRGKGHLCRPRCLVYGSGGDGAAAAQDNVRRDRATA